MILSFVPPPDLIDLVWNAALAASKALGDVTPLEILGPRKLPRISRGREIVAMLIQKHTFIEGVPHNVERGATDVTLAICFGEGSPFEDGRAIPLPSTMVGFLLGRDHSMVLVATRRAAGSSGRMQSVLLADAELSQSYTPEPIITTARIEAADKRRSWTEVKARTKRGKHGPTSVSDN